MTTQTTNSDTEDSLQAAVIHHLLDVHPAPLALSDLFRELGHPRYKTNQDELEIAVRELAKLGLLIEEGSGVRPSRAAVRYHELVAFMGGP